jgi:protocatechuate 3,4-dioxygenase beta subunit
MATQDFTGELLRKNVKEKEKGIDMYLDIQVMDINSCKPLKDLAVEIWSANSTVSNSLL